MKIDKANFWKSDWFIGVVVTIVVLFAGGGDLLQSLERKAYDLGVAMTSHLVKAASKSFFTSVLT